MRPLFHELAIIGLHYKVLEVLIPAGTEPIQDPPGSGFLDVGLLLTHMEGNDLSKFFLKKTSLKVDCDAKNFSGESVCQAMLLSEDRELRALTFERMVNFNINARSEFGQTLLQYAIEKRDLNLIRLAAKRSSQLDPATTDRIGNSLIFSAIFSNNSELFATVLQGFPQLNINEKGTFGTPAEYILSNGNIAMMQTLLANANDRLDGRIRSILGQTMLQSAISRGDPDMLKTMLKSSVDWDVNAVNMIGETVLHTVVRENRPNLAAVLIKHAKGLNLAFQNGHGKTAWSIASPAFREQIGEGLMPK